MAEETNPWKRQMMNRQNPTTTTTTPPPPTPPTTTKPSQIPNPWKQKIAEQSNKTSAPLLKSQQPSSPQQPPGKKVDSPSPQTSSNPWKSGALGGGSSLSNNPWMKGKLDKQKEQKQKQQQQRLKREQQQRRRQQEQQRERERAEEQRRQKQKQSQQRQTKLMSIQDQLSQEFQKSQKERKLKEAASEKQKQKKGPPAKPSPRKNTIPSPDKTKFKQQSQVSDNSIAYRYVNSFEAITSQHQSYSEKLERQKQILSIYKEFQSACVPRIRQIVDNHEVPSSNVSLEGGITLKFIKSKSTRNDEDSIVYDEVKMNSVKRQAELSNILQNSLIDLMRRSINVNLRTPLTTLIEYRGVLCLATARTQEEEGALFTEVTKVPRIMEQVATLLKQINKQQPRVELQHLLCKLILNSQGQEVFIIYIKEDVNIPPNEYRLKPHQLVKDLNWFQKNLQAIIESAPLEKLEHFNQFSRELANTLLLAKYIVQIYKSAQGQLDDQNFLRVIIKMDKEFYQLVQDSGFKGRVGSNKGILLLLIEKLTGLVLEYENDVFESSSISIKQALPIFRGYTFNTLECVDVSNRYLSFLQEGKEDLATESILLRLQLSQLRQSPEKISLALDQAQVLCSQEKCPQSLKQIEAIKDQIKPFTIQSLRALALLIKNHSALQNEAELLEHFNTFVLQMEFIFGQENFLSSNLYSLLATFYSKRPAQLNQAIALYQLALNINKNLFGENSVQCGDIYLAMAHSYMRNKKFEEAKATVEQAAKIYQQAENRLRKNQTLVFLGQLALVQGDKKTGDEHISKAIKSYQKLNKVNQLYRVLLLKLQYEKDLTSRQETIHALFELGNSYNKPNIVKKALELALRQEIPQLSKQRIQRLKDVQVDQQDDSAPLLQQLHRQIKNFPTISQLLRWVISLLDNPAKSSKAEALLKELKLYIGAEQFDHIIS